MSVLVRVDRDAFLDAALGDDAAPALDRGRGQRRRRRASLSASAAEGGEPSGYWAVVYSP